MRLSIVTKHVYPPIPDRSRDWCAYLEGREESGPYGWGATEAAARADLTASLEDEEDIGFIQNVRAGMRLP